LISKPKLLHCVEAGRFEEWRERIANDNQESSGLLRRISLVSVASAGPERHRASETEYGRAGVHFKLVQSIPYEGLGTVGLVPRISSDNRTVVVPTRKLNEKSKRSSVDFVVYNLLSGNAIGSLGTVPDLVLCMSPDLSLAVASTGNATRTFQSLTFYRLGAGGLLRAAISTKEIVPGSPDQSSVFSADGAYLALIDGIGRSIHIWDSRRAKVLTTVLTPDKIAHVSFSSDSTMLAALSEDGSVGVWAIPTGASVRTFEAKAGQHGWTDFVPGQPALVAMVDGAVFVWDLKTGERLSFFRLEESGWSPFGALTPDGRILITQVAAYDLHSGARLAAFEDPLWDTSTSPDGTMLATTRGTGGGNQIVRIWRIERE
jgi:WD40 repeat protein